GPNISHVSACSTGAHSIGEAMRTIRHGYADGMICGGAEATSSILGVGGFNSMRAMSTRNDAPQKASRPFDKERDGFVIGEGAGVVVLEDPELTPSPIGYINAHGTSTELNDRNETIATKIVFGDHAKKVAMSSTKSM